MSKKYVRKKTESDERSFLYREQLVCLLVSVSHLLSLFADRVRKSDRIRENTLWNKRNWGCQKAQLCQRNSVMKVSSDSKGYLYLEKYRLRQNLTLASEDVVDNRTCLILHRFAWQHKLVLMWLAKKKLRCSCFKLRAWTNHILCRETRNMKLQNAKTWPIKRL